MLVNVVPTDFHCMDKQYTETFLKKSSFLCSAEKKKVNYPFKIIRFKVLSSVA